MTENIWDLLESTQKEASKVNQAMDLIREAASVGILFMPTDSTVVLHHEAPDEGLFEDNLLEAAISLKNEPESMKELREAIDAARAKAKKAREKDYEEFKLNWMISHGFTLKDLIAELDALRAESDPDMSIKALFEDWEYGYGFESEIWPCFEEYLENEGAIVRKMYAISYVDGHDLRYKTIVVNAEDQETAIQALRDSYPDGDFDHQIIDIREMERKVSV